MSDKEFNEIESGQGQDKGTYQTGSVKPPAGSSTLVALLLAAIVLLVGLFSAMGMINVHLLRQMLQQPDSTLPMSKDPLPVPTGDPSNLHDNNDPIPSIPSNQSVEMNLEPAPDYSSLPEATRLKTAQQIYEKNAASLVQVHSLTHLSSSQTGVGVVLTQDGYILTNAHIVDSASRVVVQLANGQMVRAALVGSDPFTDMAVLYVNRRDLTPAQFCNSENLQVSEPTFAIEQLGSDSAEPNFRVSSIFGMDRLQSNNRDSLPLVQTFHGAEQGPVFNSLGQIIGMQAGRIASYFHPDDVQGLGLVIPSDVIREVVLQLTRQGSIPGRPHLGMEVETISPLYQNYWDLPGGLMLTHIHPGGTAQQQGLRPGDILLALDGRSITDREDLYRLLYSKKLGDEVIAVIYRQNRKFTVTLTIDELLLSTQ